VTAAAGALLAVVQAAAHHSWMRSAAGFVHSLAAALRPRRNPPAVAAALRAMVAAGVIAVVGAVFGDVQATGVAYLGAACSVAFVSGGVYRNRLVALLAQGCGAAVGICAGALLAAGPGALVATAAVAGAVSGLVGALGPNAPGFAMMLSIGVAFGQFGGSTLPWWQQAAWYLAGTVIVTVTTLSPWLFRRGVEERAAVAAIFFAAADTCAAVGTPDGRAARARLAAASATGRVSARHPAAELAAYAAATLYAEDRAVPSAAVDALRTAGRQTAAGHPWRVSPQWAPATPGLALLSAALTGPATRAAPPPRRGWGSAVRALATRAAAANAARVGTSMAVATLVTVVVHERAHAFWLPLTVAVIVRPEYASVFVRTVNRTCGTVLGALVAAAVTAVYPSGVAVAVAAAAALGFAVAMAPKSYGLNVIGVTASALLSASIGAPDPVSPGIRIVDTVVGAAVAVLFGYLLWPGARRLPEAARLRAALDAAQAYLREAVTPGAHRVAWQARRDDAYRLAHQAAAACAAALAEPPPVSRLAAATLPAAAELEDVVDAVTALATAVDVGEPLGDRLDDVRRRLARIEARLPGED
jgi:uncharacterized membrane protein YccC